MHFLPTLEGGQSRLAHACNLLCTSFRAHCSGAHLLLKVPFSDGESSSLVLNLVLTVYSRIFLKKSIYVALKIFFIIPFTSDNWMMIIIITN